MAKRGALYGSIYMARHYHMMNKFYLPVILMNLAFSFFGWNSIQSMISLSDRMPDRNVYTEGLNVIDLYPFSEKIHDEDVYKSFFIGCAKKSLTHDNLSFRKSFVNLQKSCFTRSGFNSYMSELNGVSGIFPSIKKGEVWNVKDVYDVTKIKEGLYKDAVFYQTWSAKIRVQRVNMKSSVNYIDDVLETTFSIKAMVVRQNNVDFKDGIAISRLVIE
ncbi:hypothetical protein V0242_24800 (plasmid) [Aeromonas hydrophila]|uniref:hypothetical protein n=1 Tax=Aeromonas hydrophila TaxID=644 RepID=UPI002ED1692B|nr:hypothetical protein V0242_24800 [Aeromonas hydrophila]